MKKMLAFFSWVPGKVAEGRKGGISPAFTSLVSNPVITPPGGCHTPSIHPAWRLSNSAFRKKIPSPACGGRWPKAGRGNKNPAFISFPKTQYLSRLTSLVFSPLGGKPCIRPACGGRWPKAGRGNKKPAFTSFPQTQYLSRLTRPVFSPLGGKPSIHPAWRAIILPCGVSGRIVAVARGTRLPIRRL